MAVLLKDREEDRSYLNLARNKIREIEESGSQQGDVATSLTTISNGPTNSTQ